MDWGIEFEYWLRFTAPWQLNLSDSKCVAMEKVFGRFANNVRPLADKHPHEFEHFFKELKLCFEKVGQWRAPRGYIVSSMNMYNKNGTKRKEAFYPNGKVKPTLWKK